MAEVIIQKAGGGTGSDECTATKAQVLAGYTAVTSDSDDEPAAGTMANQGAKTAALNCGGSYTIPAGYHNGSGKVTANSLASQTAGNLAANKIIKGYYGWSNGVKVEGNVTISSVVSFSAAAYSTSQVLCTWKNPAKGPYSGVAICAKTGGYPANINDGRVYTGAGSSSVLNATSTAVIGGLTAGATYYFRIWVYCTCSAGDLYSGYLQATCAPTAHGRQVFTSSGTFTVPANVRSIDIHCTGGGGGGGYGSSSAGSGSGNGGGGGFTSYRLGISVTPGQSAAVTVGAGGLGSGAHGQESSVSINGVKAVSAAGGTGALSDSNTGNGGSGGGAGAHNRSSSIGGAGGSDGGAGQGTSRPNNQGWGNPGWQNGGTGQGVTTREFGTGTLHSGGGGGASAMEGGIGGAGGAGGGGKGGNGQYSVGGAAGSAGTGGGGGGAYYRNAGSPGAGGSGNVIIRW